MTAEVYSKWRKSTRSDEGNCVEVSPSESGTRVGVRDTKDQGGPILEFDRGAWATFIDDVRAGHFDM
ncbi:DUF397 domain-containing protein [Actinoplanes sp. NPDC049316]|uniref:DUF397 domain-containing protein n=1 Tax=Actinoplanes sp. NPDC049316 TaxID=3154727 RepID=UPI00342D23DD